jgi:NAD(P)-dependent dehydrogenase (short-subunit alcohol dehydrogenase family)
MEQTYEVNVFGAGTVSEAFLPLLEKSEFPRIVNVSSSLGSINFQLTPDTGYPVEYLMVRIPTLHFFAVGILMMPSAQVYNTSKTALNSLTAHYSLKLKHKPGRVVSICPGYNSTNMTGYTEAGQDPAIGAKAIVRGVTEGPESEMKTGTFWNDSGKPVQW